MRGFDDLRYMSDSSAQGIIESYAAFWDRMRDIGWTNLCAACKGYPDQEHTYGDNCVSLPKEF